MLIRDIPIGKAGYTVPWAIARVGDQWLINLKYSTESFKRGSYSLLIRRTESGWAVEGKLPEIYPEIPAVISITTRKYPWTGTDDQDVAPVTIDSSIR